MCYNTKQSVKISVGSTAIVKLEQGAVMKISAPLTMQNFILLYLYANARLETLPHSGAATSYITSSASGDTTLTLEESALLIVNGGLWA